MALAQLAERRLCKAEVIGSTPIRSISICSEAFGTPNELSAEVLLIGGLAQEEFLPKFLREFMRGEHSRARTKPLIQFEVLHYPAKLCARRVIRLLAVLLR